MNDLRKAAQPEQLVVGGGDLPTLTKWTPMAEYAAKSAAVPGRAEALKQAGYTRRPRQLPKEDEQEPVAWGIVASNTGKVCQVELDREYVLGHNPAHVVPLYTAPSQRKPLTEAVIVITLRDAGYSIITNQETETAVRVFRIAERAHGIE